MVENSCADDEKPGELIEQFFAVVEGILSEISAPLKCFVCRETCTCDVVRRIHDLCKHL